MYKRRVTDLIKWTLNKFDVHCSFRIYCVGGYDMNFFTWNIYHQRNSFDNVTNVTFGFTDTDFFCIQANVILTYKINCFCLWIVTLSKTGLRIHERSIYISRNVLKDLSFYIYKMKFWFYIFTILKLLQNCW